MSCPKSYRTKQELKPYEIGNYWENLKTSLNYSLVCSLTPGLKVFSKQKTGDYFT